MSERLFVQLQHLLPKLLITRVLGFLAQRRAGVLTQWAIRRFIAHYNVDLTEAVQREPSAYATFNDFFTRALLPGVRPLATARLVCPVDGAISQSGRIERDQIFQAKGKSFSSSALLAGNEELARQFDDGLFATLYLSPRDYHRIHMPCEGRLISMSYVPGELYSVNPATARGVDALFARNERVVCHFDSPYCPFALVLVGAAIVGSIATAWHGVVNPPRSHSVRHWDYRGRNITLMQGEEMGRFLLGSTVVVLFPQGPLQLNPDWASTRAVYLGEAMAD
ncbi:phosphatidylserine decarboxylase [Trinickia violacea]|uniref:Phosphatidylserine decarboxylase proenzyme n=1 Tax=Trinickia violacea TaxID=2571746 RepID=A0A4P8IY33_9BURK|nr:archaetidylserine decarboxylase [Trinickia violacea]QCP54328.1 phosphatidylserine decarboxylase [Trinickia violacea]